MDEVIQLTGSSQTELSRLLSPPIQPHYDNFERVLFKPIGLIIIFLGIFGMLFMLVGLTQGLSWIVGLVCMVPSVFHIRRSYFTSEKNREYFISEFPRWQKAISAWQQLYYCYRCDATYLPEQNFIIQPQQMMDFIYS